MREQYDLKVKHLRHHALFLWRNSGGVAFFKPALLLACNRLTRTAAERGPVLSGECGQGWRFPNRRSYWLAIALRGRPLSAALSSPASAARGGGFFKPALLLARNRLTRTAAERGPVLSGECGQGWRFPNRSSYWPAIALRGRPLSAALSSPASAARMRFFQTGQGVAGSKLCVRIPSVCYLAWVSGCITFGLGGG